MYLMRECCLIMMHTFALHFLAMAGSTFLTSSTTIKSSTSLSSSRITTTETILSSSRTQTTTTTSAEPLLSLPLNDQDQDQDEIRTNEVLNRKCPLKCLCNYDELRRFQTICSKVGLNRFPYENIDPDVQVIIIQESHNTITMGMSLRKYLKLEVIRITESNVPAIGAESLWGLQYLKILDFSRNNISLIVQKDFRGQNNLLELNLSKNKIINIASSTFCNLTELKRLSLADNSIGELVQRIFFMLSKLKFLDLSGNPLQNLPPDVFRDVPQLTELRCRNCQLTKINPQLYNLLPQLTTLDLGRNEFQFLEKDEFRDVKRLRTIRLDGNRLSVVIEQLFRMQKNLQHLDLSYNRLAAVPNDSFLSLSNLTYLDLSYNKLEHLSPPSVRSLGHLRTINISGNINMDLYEIKTTFEPLSKLENLAIADIGWLPQGLLTSLRHLRFLNISGNHLDGASLKVIESCPKLEYLDVSRNQLYGINENVALRMQNIRNVRLDNNPLICDECHLGKLLNTIKLLPWQWETYPVCFLPKSLRGAAITALDTSVLDTCLQYISDEEQNAASISHNFLDRGDLNTFIILGGILVVFILSLVTLSVFYCTKRRARYYTQEDHLSGSREKCLEKNLSAPTLIIGTESGPANGVKNGSPNAPCKTLPQVTVNGENMADSSAGTSEINFKFPIDGHVCRSNDSDDCLLPSAVQPTINSPTASTDITTALFPSAVSTTTPNSALNSTSMCPKHHFTGSPNQYSGNSSLLDSSTHSEFVYSMVPLQHTSTCSAVDNNLMPIPPPPPPPAVRRSPVPPSSPYSSCSASSSTRICLPLTSVKPLNAPNAVYSTLSSENVVVKVNDKQKPQQQQQSAEQQSQKLQQQQQQQQQQFVHLSTFEPLVTVN